MYVYIVMIWMDLSKDGWMESRYIAFLDGDGDGDGRDSNNINMTVTTILS